MAAILSLTLNRSRDGFSMQYRCRRGALLHRDIYRKETQCAYLGAAG
jgi:hypothetical protein